MTMSFYEEGYPKTVSESAQARFRAMSEDYFTTMQIPLRAGRTFTQRDAADSEQVIVVNEALARRMWPGGEAIGKHLRWSDPERDQRPMTIVGVVADVRNSGLDEVDGPVIYAPIRQITFPWMRGFTFLVRTANEPSTMAASVRKAALGADPAKPIYNVGTLAEAMDSSLAERRFNMLLLQLFAGVALVLAAIGIYGVVAYSVTQRTQEIGIRMALGAQPAGVLGLVLREGMAPTLLGLGVGIAASLAVTRVLVAQLFETLATDPVTFAAVVAGLGGVSALACMLPARRATKVDPVIALRAE